MEGRAVGFDRLRTLNDLKLMQLGWVYDIHFSSTFRTLKDRGYLEQLAATLPDLNGVRQAKQAVFDHVNATLARLGD